MAFFVCVCLAVEGPYRIELLFLVVMQGSIFLDEQLLAKHPDYWMLQLQSEPDGLNPLV